MTSDGGNDNKLIFWKGLGLLMGISLLLIVVAWAGDRRNHAASRHETEAQFARVAEEFQTLRAESQAGAIDRVARETRLSEALSGYQADLATANAQLAEARAELAAKGDAAEMDTAELEEALRAARKQEGLARARVVRLEEYVESLKRQNDSLTANHQALEERLTATGEVAVGANAERERSRAELNDLRAKAAVLEQELAARVDECRKTNADLEIALGKLESAGSEIKDARRELAQSRSEVKIADERLAKLTAQNATMQQVTRDAEAKVLRMTRAHGEEIAQLKAATAAAQSEAQTAARDAAAAQRAAEAAAQTASQTAAASTAATATASTEAATGDSLAALRILRARDEIRARDIQRLEHEVAALKAALERASAGAK